MDDDCLGRVCFDYLDATIGAAQMIKKLWREFWCRRMCPNYLEEMPDDAPGLYIAEGYLWSGYAGGKTTILTETVEGRREAYKVARWLALKIDLRTVDHCALSVHYSVKSIAAQEPRK